MKCCIRNLYSHLSRTLKSDKNYRYFAWRPTHIYIIGLGKCVVREVRAETEERADHSDRDTLCAVWNWLRQTHCALWGTGYGRHTVRCVGNWLRQTHCVLCGELATADEAADDVDTTLQHDRQVSPKRFACRPFLASKNTQGSSHPCSRNCSVRMTGNQNWKFISQNWYE
jgi:hypothetical protein